MKPSSPSQAMLGLIGIGLLGSALAERALTSGFAVIGFDKDPDRCGLLRRLGGQPAESAAQVAAACDRIVFSLMTTAQVESVVAEMGPALRGGTVIIDTTTGDPQEVTKLASKLRRRHVAYLDAAIAGSSVEARAGNVLVLAGGNVKTLARCADIFACFARRVHHTGPCGHGARMKLVFNLVLGLNRAVLAEGLAFAKATGVSGARALEVMRDGAACSRVMDSKGPKMLSGEFSTQAKLEQHLKDVELILAAGERANAKLPLTTVHQKLLAAVARAGHGKLDNSAIIKAFE